MTTTTQALKLISEAPYDQPAELTPTVHASVSNLLFDQDFAIESYDFNRQIQKT